MATEVVLTPDAEQDLDDAFVWYETQRVGLGEEFLTSVGACLSAIRRNPELYETVRAGYRRALVRRFPYAVFYGFDIEVVTIYGAFHTSRDPEDWQRRLS